MSERKTFNLLEEVAKPGIIHYRKNGAQEIVDVSVVETPADKSLEAWQGAGDAE